MDTSQSHSVFISGSIAIDTIMNFEGAFAQVPDLSQAVFLTPQMRSSYGGCAANIAYALKQLNQDSLIVGALGHDGDKYLEYLKSINLDTRAITVFAEEHSAQAVLINDQDNHQIIAFHPGAMWRADEPNVPQTNEGYTLACISPNKPEAMQKHVRYCIENKIPFVYDPGQASHSLNQTQLVEAIGAADYLIFNSAEFDICSAKSQIDLNQMLATSKALIITDGKRGSKIFFDQQEHICTPTTEQIKSADPTGCGDAYRGALLYGLLHHLSWELIGNLATSLAADCANSISSQGYQASDATLSLLTHVKK